MVTSAEVFEELHRIREERDRELSGVPAEERLAVLHEQIRKVREAYKLSLPLRTEEGEERGSGDRRLNSRDLP